MHVRQETTSRSRVQDTSRDSLVWEDTVKVRNLCQKLEALRSFQRP